MKRKSRLGVLVRLARLEESRRLVRFATERRELQELDARVAASQRELARIGHATWLSAHRQSAPEDLRQVDLHRTHVENELQTLGREREQARERLTQARGELAQSRLRTRAFERAETRRSNEERRQHRKREEARIEEAHRAARQEVRRAPR